MASNDEYHSGARDGITRSSSVRHPTWTQGEVHSSVRAALKTDTLFRNLKNTEDVEEWLYAINMESYVPIFKEHSVTGNILLSLTSVELQKTLGIANLKDRRTIINGIKYLEQTLSPEANIVLPEDGRILTHLSNERIVLLWIRFTIILQTVAVATVRLESPDHETSTSRIGVISSLISAVAILAVIYGTFRYFWMQRMIRQPGKDHLADLGKFLTPALMAIVTAVIVMYALMAQSVEEAAALALIAV